MSVESHGKSAVIPQQTQPEASNEVEGAPENIMVTSLVVVMVLLLQVLEAPLLVRGFHNSIVQVVQFRRGSNSGAAAPKSSSISRPFLNLHDPKASPPRNHPALFANRGRKLPSPPPSPVPLQGPNWNIVNSLLVGEFIVFGVGALLALLLACDPLIGFSAAQNDIFLGVATGCVLLAASTALDNSGIEAFTNISQDTKLFVASTLGAYSPPMKLITLVVSGALALSAAFAEEFLFRGVLLQYGALSGFEPLSALFLSSLVFGLAHSPVPGASALLESLYGAAFGMVYLATGGNLLASITAHFVYDFMTFLQYHQSLLVDVEAEKEVTVVGIPVVPPSSSVVEERVKDLALEYGLSPAFISRTRAVYKKLDLNQDGLVDRRELKLGFRTLFMRFLTDKDIDEMLSQADSDQNGCLSFDEFLKLIAGELALMLQQEK